MHRRRKWQPTPVFLLENPRDGGAWWAAVYGIAQSWTRLTQLSSSSNSKLTEGDKKTYVLKCYIKTFQIGQVSFQSETHTYTHWKGDGSFKFSWTEFLKVHFHKVSSLRVNLFHKDRGQSSQQRWKDQLHI